MTEEALSEADTRRCIRAHRCVRSVPIEGKPGKFQGALLVRPGLCSGCVNAMQDGISALPADALELTSLIAAGSGPAGEYVTGSRDLPVPIRLGVEALRAQIDEELVFWCRQVTRASETTWPLYRNNSLQGMRIRDAARYLSMQIDLFVTLPPISHHTWTEEGLFTDRVDMQSGVDGALCLLELHHRAFRVVGRTKLVHRLTPACPSCGHATLVRQNGASIVTCESCTEQIDENRYNWFVQVTVAEAKRRSG